MSELKPTWCDIVVHSKGRKYNIFKKTQTYTGGALFIDGKFVMKTRRGYTYWFHIVDGKIDHFYRQTRTMSFEDSFDDDIDCPGCVLELSEIYLADIEEELVF